MTALQNPSPSTANADLAVLRQRPESMQAQVWRRFRRNPLALFGIIVLTLLALSAIFAPWLAPYDPNAVNPYEALQPPNTDHWLGTDDLGRDVLSRLLFAGRVSLMVGLFTALVAVILGALLGAIAGYYGGLTDGVIARFIDLMLSLPVVPLALVFSAFVTMTPLRLTLVLAAVSWMGVARLVRGEFLKLRHAQFTEAARSIGAPNARIIFVHLLPNAISLRNAPWLAVFSGVVITLTVASINFVGDGLREAIDPRLKER